MKRLRRKKGFRKGKPVKLKHLTRTESESEAVESRLGKQLKKAIKQKNDSKAQILIKTFKTLFPHQPLGPDLYIFEAYWEMKQYRKAIQVYRRMRCPFWLADKIGSFYERHGQAELAMVEFERLVGEFYRMKILPLPGGPVELFKLGRWHVQKNPKKAKKYLTTYLSASFHETGGANYIRHKIQAKRLLKRCGRIA